MAREGDNEEYKKLSVEERCVHSLWKARVSAYEDLSKKFRQIDDEKSPEFNKYLGLVRKFVIDSNALGQEKGLEATLSYVENAAVAGKTVNEVMSGVVTKCVAASKTRTRELALQLILMYVEIEKQEAVQEELVKGMEMKNPKIVAACVQACTQALREFGSKIFTVKPLIKKISTLFADRDKVVRDEARLMVIEIYRWIGPALRTHLNNLQPVQVTELEVEFKKLDGQKAVPTRYVRSQQKKLGYGDTDEMEVDGRNGVDNEASSNFCSAQSEVDPYDLIDPVEVLSKLPKDFYEKIEAKKWQERKEMLEAVQNLLQIPKLEAGDYGDLVRALRKVIQKDSNVICVGLAAKCIAGLALGLKRKFQTYASSLASVLLEKFKEKKQNVVVALREAIDALYLTTTIDSLSEDIIEALGNKNPSVKAETCGFLSRAFTKTLPTSLTKKLLKSLTASLTKLVNEPDPVVRDCASDAIGTLMKLVGEKAISPFLMDIEKDNLKMAKIKECCDKAVIVVKVPVSKRPGSDSLAQIKTTSASKPSSAPQPLKATAPSTARPLTGVKKKPDDVKATAVRSKSKTQLKSATKNVPLATERDYTDEEVVELVGSVVSSPIVNDLVSANWKVRLEAGQKILNDLQAFSEPKTLPTQALIRTLMLKPGLKDTNFQVLKVKLEIVKFLCSETIVTSTSANYCLNEVAEKFGDPKNGQLVNDIMLALSDALNLNFVVGNVVDFAFNQQKNPKVMQEVLAWLIVAIRDFGFSQLQSKSFIENCCKKGLASTNPAVRQAAVSLCGYLYLYLGNTLSTHFETEKPAIRDQIATEAEKYDGQKAPVPIRGPMKLGADNDTRSLDEPLMDNVMEVDVDCEEGDADVTMVPNQDETVVVVRVDLSNEISGSLLTELDDKNWKTRFEAMTKLLAIFNEHKHFKSTLGDLPPVLVHRLSDSNAKVQQMAVQACELLASGMGVSARPYTKHFTPGLLQCLGDSKAWIRTAALQAINAYVALGKDGHRDFFENEMIPDALKGGSPTLKVELWHWLGELLRNPLVKSVPKDELILCIPHLFSHLEDRNADVRKNANDAVLGIMTHVGYEAMIKEAEKLKPSSKCAVIAVLDKVRPNLPVKPVAVKCAQDRTQDKIVRGTKPVANSKNAVKPKGAAIKSGTIANSVAPPHTGTTTNQPNSNRRKEEELDNSPLLSVNNLKNQRTIDESKLKILRWNFTSPREEFFDLLKEQMTTANVNRTLINNMFHVDFRYHLKALDLLLDDLPVNSDALIANLDLILKWLTLRFFDTNPSVLLKGLEYLQAVFQMLTDAQYQMLENEASSFLPYLITKIGDPKDSVRNGVRNLFKQICNVYPTPRMFTFVLEGIKSKNSRQRAECLELMGLIIKVNGITVCLTPSIFLKEVAKQISDRDTTVRNAALNCLVEVYDIINDRIFKLIGNISDKDLSLLEERIKRSRRHPKPSLLISQTSPQKDNSITGAPVFTVPQAVPQIHKNIYTENIEEDNCNYDDEYKNEIDDCDEEKLALPPELSAPQTIHSPYMSNHGRGANNVPSDALNMGGEPHFKNSPFRLDERYLKDLDRIVHIPSKPHIQQFDLSFLNEVVHIPSLSDLKVGKVIPISPPKPLDPNACSTNANNNTDSVDTLAMITKLTSSDLEVLLCGLQQVVDHLNTDKRSDIGSFEDQLLDAIAMCLRTLRKYDPNHNYVARIYRQTLLAIDLFYVKADLGRGASVETLHNILDEFIFLLVDLRLQSIPNEGDQYIRVINLHCVKVIERSDHSRVISALIRSLQEKLRTDDVNGRRIELIMKCIWRILKLMPTWDGDLDYDLVLYDIHQFLKEFPSYWWKRQTLDTPVRTIKTLLLNCVKRKQGAIVAHVNKIPNKEESEMEMYVLKLLKSFKTEEPALLASMPAAHNTVSKQESPVQAQPQRLSFTRESHNILTEIFQKIGSKEHTKEGLNQLYDFMHEHPEADIEPFLNKTSKFFQDYIQNGLKDVAVERQFQTRTIENEVERKVAESVSVNSNTNSLNSHPETERSDPEYWRKRLQMWKLNIQ